MTHFPITKSFLATDALSQQLADTYGLTNVRCQLITSTVRDVYLVTTLQQRFILFVYRHGYRPFEQIAAEWHFVAYLTAHGVPVAPAVFSRHGDLLLQFDAPEGTRYGVLTPFVPGQQLRQRPSAAAVRSFGHHIARIHVVADTMSVVLSRPKIDVAALLEHAVAAIETALLDRPDAVTYLQTCVPRLQAQLQAILANVAKAPPAYGLIHGDVIRANALVDDDGAVTVLDFDFCGRGWRSYDIASYLLTIRGTPNEREFADAFLAGYTEIRTLLPVEHVAIPLFEAVRAIFEIGTPATYVNHWGSAYLYAFLDQSLEKLKHRMDHIT